MKKTVHRDLLSYPGDPDHAIHIRSGDHHCSCRGQLRVLSDWRCVRGDPCRHFLRCFCVQYLPHVTPVDARAIIQRFGMKNHAENRNSRLTPAASGRSGFFCYYVDPLDDCLCGAMLYDLRHLSAKEVEGHLKSWLLRTAQERQPRLQIETPKRETQNGGLKIFQRALLFLRRILTPAAPALFHPQSCHTILLLHKGQTGRIRSILQENPSLLVITTDEKTRFPAGCFER